MPSPGLLEMMPDPPPLHFFALGALYQRLGNHDAAVQYLSRLGDDQQYDETHRIMPSPQLRRYVMMLRRLEQHPAAEPQTLAAIRNLERARQRSAGKMLLDSRSLSETTRTVGSNASAAETGVAADKKLASDKKLSPEKKLVPEKEEELFSPSAPLSSISAPPPIATVLHDIYQDETGANN